MKALGDLPHDYKTTEQRARTGGIAACQAIVRELPSVTPKQTDALEKIRAEIKEQYGGCGLINDGLDMALSVIDKYIKGEDR